MNVNQKIMAKSMNKSKNFETYFEFFYWAIFEINFSKYRYFLIGNEGEKNMAKSINRPILGFIWD